MMPYRADLRLSPLWNKTDIFSPLCLTRRCATSFRPGHALTRCVVYVAIGMPCGCSIFPSPCAMTSRTPTMSITHLVLCRYLSFLCFHQHHILHTLCVASSTKIAGPRPRSSAFPPLCSGAHDSPGVFCCERGLYDTKAGLLAAALTAASSVWWNTRPMRAATRCCSILRWRPSSTAHELRGRQPAPSGCPGRDRCPGCF
jgi:hypothetical protein